MTNENRAMKSYALNFRAHGHPSKGKGKRAASKARRRLGKALCAS